MGDRETADQRPGDEGLEDSIVARRRWNPALVETLDAGAGRRPARFDHAIGAGEKRAGLGRVGGIGLRHVEPDPLAEPDEIELVMQVEQRRLIHREQRDALWQRRPQRGHMHCLLGHTEDARDTFPRDDVQKRAPIGPGILDRRRHLVGARDRPRCPGEMPAERFGDDHTTTRPMERPRDVEGFRKSAEG